MRDDAFRHQPDTRAQGRLAGIRLTAPASASMLLLTHERRWRAYPDHMAEYRTRPLLHRFAIGGVPMFSIYALGP